MTLKLVVNNGPVEKEEEPLLTKEQLIELQDMEFMMAVLRAVNDTGSTDVAAMCECFKQYFEGIPDDAIEYGILTNLPELLLSGAITLDSQLSEDALQLLMEFDFQAILQQTDDDPTTVH